MQCVSSIKSSLDYIVNPETAEVCIITYDSSVHFYSLPEDPNADPTVY
jgi:hypothetical protein